MEYAAQQFLNNAMRKRESGQHLTFYEKCAVGGYYTESLKQSDITTIQIIVDETYDAEREKVERFRMKGLESYANDIRMETPIMLKKDQYFRKLTFDFISGKAFN